MCNVYITILLCGIIKDICMKIQALHFYPKKIYWPIMQISILIYKQRNKLLYVQRIINCGMKIFFFNAKIKIQYSYILLRVLYGSVQNLELY